MGLKPFIGIALFLASSSALCEEKIGNLRIQLSYFWSECTENTDICEETAFGEIELFANVPIESDNLWESTHHVSLSYMGTEKVLQIVIKKEAEDSTYQVIYKIEPYATETETPDLFTSPPITLRLNLHSQKSIYTQLKVQSQFFSNQNSTM